MSSSAPRGWEPPLPEELQKMLPQYEITGILGRGGMGAVYKGVQKNLDRVVAIKVLPELLYQEGDEMNFVARFKLEARAMAKLNHPAILSVYDFGETSEGQLYFVMEFVDGMDIQEYLKQQGGVLQQEHAITITAYVLDALEYAHNNGIVHRDIKPANILLNHQGQVKIADFGLAKALSTGEEEDVPALTMSNVALGTPDFVAPEALDCDGIPDHRADLYAVGVMLYQMLTGVLPRGQCKMPSELLEHLDPRLDDVVQMTLQTNPDDRYSSASDLRIALDPIITSPMSRVQMVEQQQVEAEEIQASQVQLAKKKKAKTGITIGAGVAALLVIGGLVAFVMSSGDKQDGSETPVVKSTEPTKPPVKKDQPAKPVEVVKSSPEKIPASLSPGNTATTLASATKTKPYENSLGMRFVPVPITGGPSDGKTVLFSIWETRVKDYEAFINDNKGHEWPKVEWKQEGDHPAANLSWDDAVAFCAWLTEQDRKKGKLGKDKRYRLPTDHEWSCAVGLGKEEDAGLLPSAKDAEITDIYPWGNRYPPPKGAGNYYGEECERNPEINRFNNKNRKPIKGYDDGFDRTSPVGGFEANEYGLYDTGGNVWEWCVNRYSTAEGTRVLRGASWAGDDMRSYLWSSRRLFAPAGDRRTNFGVRVVVAGGGGRKVYTQTSFYHSKAHNYPGTCRHSPFRKTSGQTT